MALGARFCESGAESGGLEGQAREQTVWRLTGGAQHLCGARLDGGVRLPPSCTWSSSGSSLWTLPWLVPHAHPLLYPPEHWQNLDSPGPLLSQRPLQNHEHSWHLGGSWAPGAFRGAQPAAICPQTPTHSSAHDLLH